LEEVEDELGFHQHDGDLETARPPRVA
jgi:hypothetical protein